MTPPPLSLRPNFSRLRNSFKNVLQKRQRVVCCGLSKTGTTTFMEACEILGYKHKSMGFDHAFVNRRILPIYLAALRYESFDDYPWFFMYRFFDKNFPATKFVLTVRSNVERWYESIVNHEVARGNSGVAHRFRTTYGLSSPLEQKSRFCQFYERHNETVREYFRGDPRFIELCWEDGDGWDELCDFLERPIPDQPFPHANKGARRTPGA